MDVLGCFLLAWMLQGDFVFDDPMTISMICDCLDIPFDLSALMKHVVFIGTALDWKLWEKTVDVYMCDYHDTNIYQRVKEYLINIDHPYTMEEVAFAI
jgi:hypothetical protein